MNQSLIDREYETSVQALMPGNHGLTNDQRNRLAFHLEDRIVRRSEVASQAFVDNGRDLWRVYHLELFRELQQETFDAWLDLPQINITRSSGYLSIQVIDLFELFFRIPPGELYGVGEKKYQLVTPYVAGLQRDVLLRAEVATVEEWYEERRRGYDNPQGDLAWHHSRLAALGWLEDGRTMSYNALLARGVERRGWTVHSHPTVPMWQLRQARSVDELLVFLGLSELPDDLEVNMTFKSPKPLPQSGE